ncbi:MAG: AMP-dependent synthetase/ligase [Flavobacteriaceae bacterium]
MPIAILPDLLDHHLQHTPLDGCLNMKVNGQWVKTSSEEYNTKVQAMSRALLNLGIKKGDKVALISTNNRTEWCITDMGLQQIGAVNVPIYPTISAQDYAYILNHSESQICFVSDADILAKINEVRAEVPSLKEIYSFDEINDCASWTSLVDSGMSAENQADVLAAKASVVPEDLATIIYTSGTTGTPKGVMLSHSNIVSNILSSAKRLPLTIGQSSALSFLPVCHIFERVILYLYLYSGVRVYFAESLETIGDNLKEVKPNVMTAVPRLLEKVYDKIYAKGEELSGIKQKLFYWAVDVGLAFEPYGKNGFVYNLKHAIAKKLVLSKWKEGLGGNLDLICSGSAALQPRLARVFTAAGITLVEGYGLTETSPVISVNDMRGGKFKIGSVGKVIDGVEVKIAEDGEILCKGPNVMQGYYKDPKKTEEVMTGEYFHTGDIGTVDAEGFLKITDRKKQLFKTSGGKYVAPQLLENALKQSLFVEQIVVVGEGRKMPAAIIQPNFEYLAQWYKDQNIDINSEDLNAMCASPELLKAIQSDIDQQNVNFGKWEQVKKFELVPEIWSIDGGQLTPTMKVKRNVLLKQYESLIEEIYS